MVALSGTRTTLGVVRAGTIGKPDFRILFYLNF